MSFQQKFTIVIPPQDIACDPGCLIKLANGDKEAYAWVYKNYCKKVYDYALLITGNEAVSEDIVQEVFLKLWQHRQKLKSIENFNNYLYILYRNHIMDVMKGRQKELSVRHEYCDDVQFTDILPDDIIDGKQALQKMEKIVMQLPRQQQLVYKLSREHGWKRDQIAEEMKIRPNSVKTHLQLALKFLKKKLSII